MVCYTFKNERNFSMAWGTERSTLWEKLGFILLLVLPLKKHSCSSDWAGLSIQGISENFNNDTRSGFPQFWKCQITTWLPIWFQVLSLLLLGGRNATYKPKLGSLVQPFKVLFVTTWNPSASSDSTQQKVLQYGLFKHFLLGLHRIASISVAPQQNSAKAHCISALQGLETRQTQTGKPTWVASPSVLMRWYLLPLSLSKLWSTCFSLIQCPSVALVHF